MVRVPIQGLDFSTGDRIAEAINSILVVGEEQVIVEQLDTGLTIRSQVSISSGRGFITTFADDLVTSQLVVEPATQLEVTDLDDFITSLIVTTTVIT